MEKQIDLKKTILWVVVGVLTLLAIYTTFFSGSVSSNIIPAGSAAGQVASSGMVGGC